MASAPLNGTITFPKAEGAKYLCLGGDSNSAGTGEALGNVTIYRTSIYSKALTRGEVAYLFQSEEG